MLAAALERCAARDPAGLAELRAWQGGRLRETLLRTLGDPALADRALEGALADLWDNAALHHTLGRGPAEDRVFAVLRRHAHALLRERGSPVPPQPPSAPLVRSVPPTPTAPHEPPQLPSRPAGTMPVSPGEPAAVPSIPASPAPVAAPGTAPLPDAEPLPPAARRLRRPDATGSFDHAYPPVAHKHRSERSWRRWLFLLLAWIAAAGTGFGLAFVAFQLPGNRDASMLWRPEERTPPPAVTRAPQPPPRPAEAPPKRPPVAVLKPSAQDVGEPLKASEPPAVALRPLELQDEPATLPSPPPAAPDPALAIAPALPAPVPRPRPVVEARLPVEARIFVHFTAGDDASAARAEALQSALQRRGADSVQLVPVRFPIGTASVRYFYPEDRPTAERLLQGARNELAASGRPTPGEPTDFTRFRPSPRPGTIEVWLPGG